MDLIPMALAAGVGFVLGWAGAGYQHLLYRQPEYRQHPAGERKLLALRLFLGLAMALTGALALRPDHYEAGPAFLTVVFAWVLCILSSTDFERRIIPNRLSYPAIVAAVVLAWAWPDRSLAASWAGGGICFAAGAVLFLVGLLLARAGAFGMGDLKLMVLVGLLTAWPGVVTALLIGILVAGVPGLVLSLSGRGRTYFSYGPYLALGGLAVMLFPDTFA